MSEVMIEASCNAVTMREKCRTQENEAGRYIEALYSEIKAITYNVWGKTFIRTWESYSCLKIKVCLTSDNFVRHTCAEVATEKRTKRVWNGIVVVAPVSVLSEEHKQLLGSDYMISHTREIPSLKMNIRYLLILQIQDSIFTFDLLAS